MNVSFGSRRSPSRIALGGLLFLLPLQPSAHAIFGSLGTVVQDAPRASLSNAAATEQDVEALANLVAISASGSPILAVEPRRKPASSACACNGFPAGTDLRPILSPQLPEGVQALVDDQDIRSERSLVAAPAEGLMALDALPASIFQDINRAALQNVLDLLSSQDSRTDPGAFYANQRRLTTAVRIVRDSRWGSPSTDPRVRVSRRRVARLLLLRYGQEIVRILDAFR